MTYTRTSKEGFVSRDVDGAMIPTDPANQDFQDFLAWEAAGNTPSPVPVPSHVPVTLIPSLDFIQRFTAAEQLAITTAALSSGPLLLWLVTASSAQLVDLTSPITTAGVTALVTAGLLNSARQPVILAPA